MLLRENLEQTGQRLFRWRSYQPLVLLVFLPIASCRYEHPFGCPKNAVLYGEPRLDRFWQAVAAIGLLTFVVVRFLRKSTILLDVPNR